MSRFIILLSLLLVVRLLVFNFFPPKSETISKNVFRETTIFTQIKDHINSSYNQTLSRKNAGLLAGIVFGEKELDKNSLLNFQKTGVLHIIAASGMNVSMLTSFLLAFFLLFLRRQYALVFTIAAVLFYAALADFQPSIVRAAIMAIFALGAGLTGRQNTSLFALFLAAFIMIFWDPAVITSISFILSFTATLGIIVLDPIMKKGAFRSPLFEDFRTTTAAQIATTPILLFFFGTYSPVSIISNFLVLWTVPPLMAAGMIAAILSFVSQYLAAPFLYFCFPLLAYFWTLIDYFAQVSVPIKIDPTPWAIVVGYYLILGGVIIWINQRTKNQIPKSK